MEDTSSLAEEDFAQEEKPIPKINVTDPVTLQTDDGERYTTYRIDIQTDHPSFHLSTSSITRRFSEVQWLYKELKDNLKTIKLPKPPPKTLFAPRFDLEFITNRQRDIELFLNELAGVMEVLADLSFHLFLQTDLTTQEMDEYLDGSLPDHVIEMAWRNGGHIHSRPDGSSSNEREDFVANVENLLSADIHRPLGQQVDDTPNT